MEFTCEQAKIPESKITLRLLYLQWTLDITWSRYLIN